MEDKYLAFTDCMKEDGEDANSGISTTNTPSGFLKNNDSPEELINPVLEAKHKNIRRSSRVTCLPKLNIQFVTELNNIAAPDDRKSLRCDPRLESLPAIAPDQINYKIRRRDKLGSMRELKLRHRPKVESLPKINLAPPVSGQQNLGAVHRYVQLHDPNRELKEALRLHRPDIKSLDLLKAFPNNLDLSCLDNYGRCPLPQLTIATPDGRRPGDDQVSWAWQGNAWTAPNRVIISDSLLNAYRDMRGNNDKETWLYGPLHDALFLHPRGHFNDGCQIYLPQLIKDPKYGFIHPSHDYPAGTIFFWEPLHPVRQDPPRLLTTNNNRSKEKSAKYSTLNGYLNSYLLVSNNMQSRGDDAYAEYGYIKVKDAWVDPESEGEIADAIRCKEPSAEKLTPILPVGGGNIMTPEEINDFYAEYTKEVSEGEDGDKDGDPRLTRISPATFARWAQGASIGDRYFIDEEIYDLAPLIRKPFDDEPVVDHKTLRTQHDYQYDYDTGSIMTGIYDVESNPQMIFDPQGVVMDKFPSKFAMMNPVAAQEFRHAAYQGKDFAPGTKLERGNLKDENLAALDGSHQALVYGSQGGCDEFNTPSDPSGDRHYAGARGYLTTMTGYYNNVLKETHPRVSAINVYHSRSHQLHYEVFFMKRALAQQIPQDEDQAVIVRSILSMPNYPVNGRQNIPIVTSIPYNSPSMNLAVGRDDIQKVSGAYAQYFEEREQLDHMTIRESELNLLRTNAALVPVMDRFNYLISLHGLLKVQLGVNGDDLTGIAPYRPHVDEARTLEGIIQAFGRHRMQDAEEAHSLSSARTFTLYSQVAHLDC